MRFSTAALVLLGLFAVHAVADYIEDPTRMPGWRGELPTSLHADLVDSTGLGEMGEELWRGRIEQVSWEPRAFVFHGFLSDEECDHLIKLASSHLHKSTVVDSKTGGSIDSEVRTSSGTFLQYRQDDVVARIERRISLATMIPEENGESLQILKYVDGQKYEPHTDYFHDKVNSDPAHGGQRVATVLMYLTTPEEGGETVFPHAAEKPEYDDTWSECAKRGLAVKAKRGNALFFYGLKPDGSEDPRSTHGSCPTLKGEKYSATKWIHVSAFNKKFLAAKNSGDSPDCIDSDKRCEEWAIYGECEKNSGFMMENCRKSCKACGKTPAGEQQPGFKGKVTNLGRKADP